MASAARVAHRYLTRSDGQREATVRVASVRWNADDMVTVLPIPEGLRKQFPAKSVERTETVMVLEPGSSDKPGPYKATRGSGQEVTIYGWQVASTIRSKRGEDLGVAPSAENHFWHNPERYEVRQLAETGAPTNDPEVAVESGEGMDLPKGEVAEDVEQAEAAPPTPTEIRDAQPGGEQFSTLNRYLVETEQPTPSLPSGEANRPQAPDPEKPGELLPEGRVAQARLREARLREAWRKLG